jgi:hypothetical protein
LLEYLGDVGGLQGLVFTFFGYFITKFSNLELKGLIANHFFTWEAPESWHPDSKYQHNRCFNCKTESSKVKKGPSTSALRKRESEDYIPIPSYLDWNQLWFSVISCCPAKWYVDYKDALNVVHYDLEKSLDILTMLRRLRMHGMALSMLVEKETKILIAERSRDKPLNYVKALKTDTGNPSLW